MLENSYLKSYFNESSNELILIKVLLSFGTSILLVAPALFLKESGLSDSFIGFILGIIGLVSLLFSLFSTVILEQVDKYRVILISIFTYSLFLLLLIFYPKWYVFIIFFLVFNVFNVIQNNSFSIIFKDTVKKSELVQKESLMYSLRNVGWFIGPLLGGLLIESYGFVELFSLSFLFYLLVLFICLSSKIELKKKKYKTIDSNIIKNIIYYFNKKELIKSYYLGFICNFWYALIFIYFPLFIVNANLSKFWVGFFIASTQFPLIFVEFKLNWFIKKFGAKKLLITAFLYLSIITLYLFFYFDIIVAMFLLFTSAFFIAFIEPLREIYFFKNVREIEEEKTFPVFSTSANIGSIIGKLFFSLILLIFVQEYVFLFMSLFMLISIYIVFSFKDFRK